MMTHIIGLKAKARIDTSVKGKTFCKIRRYLTFFPIVILITALKVSTPVSAAEAQYNNPKVDGYALDYCKSWGKDCGKPAADEYCRSKGYRGTVGFHVKQNSPPTKVISSGEICSAPGCDRIDRVSCEADAAFKNPKVNNYALDFCRQWGEACGKPAADAFCRSKGYRESVDFAVRHDNPPTRLIGTGQICNQLFCDRIVLVTCKDRTLGGGGGAGGKADEAGDTMMTTEGEEEFVIFDK